MKKLLKEILRPLYYFLKDRKLREFYRLCDKWGGYERYVYMENVSFLNYKFDVPDLPSFIWQFKEIFVDEIYRFDTDSDMPIIYDCGANIGMSVLYFKTLYPKSKIVAFEADPKIADILRRNLSKNDVLNGVQIVDAGVWIDNTVLEFSVDGADAGSIYGDGTKIKVKAIRLKEWLQKEPIIDMLKLDIEGAEYEVLRDCTSVMHKIKNLFVECHSFTGKEQRIGSILKILENDGFRYYLENVSVRKNPFVNKMVKLPMDLQVNIFAYRL